MTIELRGAICGAHRRCGGRSANYTNVVVAPPSPVGMPNGLYMWYSATGGEHQSPPLPPTARVRCDRRRRRNSGGRGGGVGPEVACARPDATGADGRRTEPTAAVDAAIRPALPTNRRRARSPAFSLHLFGRGYFAGARTHARTTHHHQHAFVRSSAGRSRSPPFSPLVVGAAAVSSPPVWSFRHSRPSSTYARRSSSACSHNDNITNVPRSCIIYRKLIFFFLHGYSR